MSHFILRIWRFLLLSNEKKGQILLITLLLAKMRIKTKYQPAQRLFQFSPFQTGVASLDQPDVKPLIRRIKQIAALVWWRALCLEQALTLSACLARQHIAHTLYVGVKRDQRAEFAAHAWVTIDHEVVLGGPVDDYQVIAVYPRGAIRRPDEPTPLDIGHS